MRNPCNPQYGDIASAHAHPELISGDFAMRPPSLSLPHALRPDPQVAGALSSFRQALARWIFPSRNGRQRELIDSHQGGYALVVDPAGAEPSPDPCVERIAQP
jgi:hypothetical protein